MAMIYLLKPAVLNPEPEITISKQEYIDVQRCREEIYEAFEIELAFDFVVNNYIEIEKYIAEHLVLNMVGQPDTLDAWRKQHWGFMQTLNNWLASISLWRDLTQSRLASICGHGDELRSFKETHLKLQNDEFAYALLFHLRNFSQHGGFPVTGMGSTTKWNEEGTQLSHSGDYTLNYEQIRPYFEKGGQGARNRKGFGKRVEEYSQGNPFDLKPIIRQSIGLLGKFMDDVRNTMNQHVTKNENFIQGLIKRFQTAHPNTSVIALSVMPVDSKTKIVKNKADIISVRNEFILRAREMRNKNNGKTLVSMEKRIISNA